MGCAHRDNRTLGNQRANHGHHALGLLVGGKRLLAGNHWRSAHVDDIRALVEHLEATLGGGLGVDATLAVREGLWGHVENAHDARARERELVRADEPGCIVLSEHRHRPPVDGAARERDGGSTRRPAFRIL